MQEAAALSGCNICVNEGLSLPVDPQMPLKMWARRETSPDRKPLSSSRRMKCYNRNKPTSEDSKLSSPQRQPSNDAPPQANFMPPYDSNPNPYRPSFPFGSFQPQPAPGLAQASFSNPPYKFGFGQNNYYGPALPSSRIFYNQMSGDPYAAHNFPSFRSNADDESARGRIEDSQEAASTQKEASGDRKRSLNSTISAQLRSSKPSFPRLEAKNVFNRPANSRVAKQHQPKASAPNLSSPTAQSRAHPGASGFRNHPVRPLNRSPQRVEHGGPLPALYQGSKEPAFSRRLTSSQ
ncbi:Hypothetical predicted protein [Cloeon dipterum]|uniref:Uncharacterized protein n=3 Tax=Cloeon dipterum TaxID=197152 RepID=A0A8S1CM65_9INSE|nr:Hypothetical predicted protein [Cloeon dipterum]